MATYYHGNTADLHNGGDGLQTLILMNPSYIGVNSDGSQQTSPATTNNSNYHVYLPHAPPHFVGLPLSASTTSSQGQELVPMVGVQAARELQPMPRGPSLSLSSVQRGYSTEDLVGNQVLSGSKYIRAAQELLDEAVNVVGRSIAEEALLSEKEKASGGGGDPPVNPSPDASDGKGGRNHTAAELSTAERQEMQMKKAKLMKMLDEVEQRYKQYHKQMNTVTSWFEQVAGLGSAEAYTALALRTISNQFRCLKVSILNQIKSASKSLGEKEIVSQQGGNKIKEGSNRLKYNVDSNYQQIRQQRALHMVHQGNAWRPQRGLPERAVSVLRAWFFEHFLHPYPKDSDKITLANQTGLSRSQVSNWFINARVRLWKPMVEEMYGEEMKEQENYKNVPPSSSDQFNDQDSSPNKPANNHQPQSKKPFNNNTSYQENPINHNHDHELLLPKIDMKHQPPPMRDDHGFSTLTGFTGGFGSNPIAQLSPGRLFGPEDSLHRAARNNYSGNAVSLTLGLPHWEINKDNNVFYHRSTSSPGFYT